MAWEGSNMTLLSEQLTDYRVCWGGTHKSMLDPSRAMLDPSQAMLHPSQTVLHPSWAMLPTVAAFTYRGVFSASVLARREQLLEPSLLSQRDMLAHETRTGNPKKEPPPVNPNWVHRPQLAFLARVIIKAPLCRGSLIINCKLKF